MSNLVNVVKTVLGSKFDVRSFEVKNRVFEFDHQQMNIFEFVRCSKNDVRVQSMFDKMVFDPSLKNTENGTIKIFKLIFHTVLIFAHHCCFFNLICSTIFYPRSICSISSKHQLRRVTHTVRAIALIFHSCDKIRGSPNCTVYKNLSTYRQVKFCLNF